MQTSKLLSGKTKGEGVITGVIVVIAIAIAILIGYIVLVQVQNVTQGAGFNLSSSQSTQLNNLANTLTGTFLLTTVLPIVVVAGLILGGFFAFMGFGQGGGIEVLWIYGMTQIFKLASVSRY